MSHTVGNGSDFRNIWQWLRLASSWRSPVSLKAVINFKPDPRQPRSGVVSLARRFNAGEALARALRRVATVEFRRHYVTQWAPDCCAGVKTPA
jgi:hypothetical protein